MYKDYGGTIYGLIRRITKEDQLSQELLQNVFLNVWGKAHLYNPDKGSIYTWLRIMARNLALDKVRQAGFKNREKTESLDPTVYESKSITFLGREIDVQILMNKLEPKYRSILEGIYIEGYSHNDLASKLELPLGTVKSRLRKAILILRGELDAEKKLFLGFLLLTLTILCLCL